MRLAPRPTGIQGSTVRCGGDRAGFAGARAVIAAALAALLLLGVFAAVPSPALADAIEHPNTTWISSTAMYRHDIGGRYLYDCPPNGEPDNVLYGTDIYTDSSRVCLAAVHYGLITFESGGMVEVEIRPGLDSYTGSTRNGVTSQDWPLWNGSFVFTSEPPAPEPEPSPDGTFRDVPAGSVHEPGIEAVAEAGITTGCAEGLYCPGDPVNRAQMATFLMRAADLEDPGGDPFSDVDVDFVHAPGIRAVEAEGITTGCAPGRYCPAEPVTRAQMATFLMRAAELEDPGGDPFEDVEVDFVHAPGIRAVEAEGITTGCAPGRYCPAEPVTRAQMATFLMRAFLAEG